MIMDYGTFAIVSAIRITPYSLKDDRSIVTYEQRQRDPSHCLSLSLSLCPRFYSPILLPLFIIFYCALGVLFVNIMRS